MGQRWTEDGAVVIRAEGGRSRARSREAARARLAALVREALVPSVPRVATVVPEGERRRGW